MLVKQNFNAKLDNSTMYQIINVSIVQVIAIHAQTKTLALNAVELIINFKMEFA